MRLGKLKQVIIMLFILVTVVSANCYTVSYSLQKRFYGEQVSSGLNSRISVAEKNSARMDNILTGITKGIGSTLLNQIAHVERIDEKAVKYLYSMAALVTKIIAAILAFLWIRFLSIPLVHSESNKTLICIHKKDGKKRVFSCL